MKTSHAMLFGIALSLAACGDGDPTPGNGPQTAPESLGELELRLTGADSAGVPYRLRNAQFTIWGYPDYATGSPDGGFFPFVTTVSTETDPDAPLITLRVVPGYYNVNLDSPAWYLERKADTTWERVEQAILLGSTSTGTSVWNGGVSQVFYRFGVDGELIDFRAGDLQIGIEIEKPGEFPADAGFPPFPGLFGGTGGLLGGGIPGGGFGGTDAGVILPL
jgi:hypothetical protein